MGRKTIIIALACLASFLGGCAETPHKPVLRPIPPPPSTPPPGVTYIPQPPTVATNIPQPQTPHPTVITPNAAPGYEISTNFTPNANLQNAPGTEPSSIATVTPDASGIPQYEVVPEQPGPDYIWADGYWSWQGRWIWVPGRWIWQPQPHVIITPGFYWGPRYYYGPG